MDQLDRSLHCPFCIASVVNMEELFKHYRKNADCKEKLNKKYGEKNERK